MSRWICWRCSCSISIGAGTDDAVLQPEERVELLPRQAHQAEEHRRRELLGELVGEVALATGLELVDEVVDPGGDVVLDGVHLAGREDRVEDLAVLEVAGRVDAERDERAHVAELEEALRREHLGVLEGGLDRPPARHHVHAGHGLHDLGLDQVLVDRLRARGVAQALGREHHRGRIAPVGGHDVGREGLRVVGVHRPRVPGTTGPPTVPWTETDAISHTPKGIRRAGSCTPEDP